MYLFKKIKISLSKLLAMRVFGFEGGLQHLWGDGADGVGGGGLNARVGLMAWMLGGGKLKGKVTFWQ